MDGLLAGARGSLGHSPDRRRCVAQWEAQSGWRNSWRGRCAPRCPHVRSLLLGPHSVCVPCFTSVCMCVHGLAAHTHSPPVPAAASSRSPRGRGALVPEAAWGPCGEDTASAGRALLSLPGVSSEDGSGGPALAIGLGSAPFPLIQAAACQCPAAPPGPGAALPPRRGREQCTHMVAVSVCTRASLCCLGGGESAPGRR